MRLSATSGRANRAGERRGHTYRELLRARERPSPDRTYRNGPLVEWLLMRGVRYRAAREPERPWALGKT
jgi:hypothetical protein